METFIQALRNLGPMRLTMMGGVVMGMIGFFIFLVTRLGSPQMELLYGNLDQADSSKIIAKLEASNVPYELKGGGTQIFIPSDKVGSMRLTTAGEGLPSGGSVGYEIFDDASSLGTTNFLQNINLVRALEGELARTVRSINSVSGARVHLVMPKRELFSREKQEPSASIILKMKGATRLGSEQVAAVQYLVAAAVPGLTPNRISIIDNKGSLLARGFETTDSASLMAEKADSRRRSFENRLSRTIEQLLEKTVGFGKVRAEVTAAMDFDRISTNEIKYDADGQVVLSSQTIEESNKSQDADNNQPISVATNLPDANLTGGDQTGSTSAEKRTEENINYENSKKVINLVRETGMVRKLSVAVLVDGTRTTNEAGDQVYQPRPQEEMELLATLVRSAIGFDADRGDSVDVVNMEFVDMEGIPEETLEIFFGLGKNDLLRMAEFLVLGIVAILVILLVLRPLVSRAFEAIPSAMGTLGPDGRLLADQAPALTGPGAPPPVPTDAPHEEEQFEELIDIDQIEGRVKASSVKKVGEIVEKHPEEAISILRNWLYQD